MSGRSHISHETVYSSSSEGSQQKSRSRGQSFLSPRTITIMVISCCTVNLGIAFYQGTLLPAEKVDLIEHHGRLRPVLKADYRMSHLQCEEFGGPGHQESQEMVYWQEIPEDSKFTSPFKEEGATRYLTFEPDGGGFNNGKNTHLLIVFPFLSTDPTFSSPDGSGDCCGISSCYGTHIGVGK